MQPARGRRRAALLLGGAGEAGSKLCEALTTLQYGDRGAFIRGLDDILARPSLTLAQEFGRSLAWEDWRGVRYTLQDELAYVSGPAAAKAGCAPGTATRTMTARRWTTSLPR